MAFVTSLIRVLIGHWQHSGLSRQHDQAPFSADWSTGRPNADSHSHWGGIRYPVSLGALAAYPLATFFLSQEAAVFGFVIPFGVSSFGGALISLVILLGVAAHQGLGSTSESLSSR